MTATTLPPPRIVTLDIIRGVAVMGIFSVNIVAFAMIEAAYLNPPAYGGDSGANLLLWAANLIVIDGKMRSLFSILFGASMLLVIERAAASGISSLRIHMARMAVLFAIGMIHYHLIWFGDILHLYAAVGVIAYLFRNRSPRALMRWAIGFTILHLLIFSGITAYVVQLDQAAHSPGATAAAIREWNDMGGSFYPSAKTIAKDLALHHAGFSALAYHQIVEKSFDWVPGLLLFTPETLALMLFGMAAYKSGFLPGRWDESAYRKVAVIGLSLGALASAALVVADMMSRFYVPVVLGGFMAALAPFRPLMAFGYAALIILLTRNGGWLTARLAAVGRAAFTNYLGTSLIATFLFEGWGLGLYGSVSRWQAWLLVPVVWGLMLLWSKPWLDRYHYGPFEWLWRSLARGGVQPMRRRPEMAPALPAE
jgi:uncharacterized protein